MGDRKGCDKRPPISLKVLFRIKRMKEVSHNRLNQLIWKMDVHMCFHQSPRHSFIVYRSICI